MMATAMMLRAHRAKNGVQCRRRHAIVRRILNLCQRQREQIRQIRQAVQRDDDHGAESHRERHVALRDFSLRPR